MCEFNEQKTQMVTCPVQISKQSDNHKSYNWEFGRGHSVTYSFCDSSKTQIPDNHSSGYASSHQIEITNKQ